MDSISREFGNWFEEHRISGLDGYGEKSDYVTESDLRKYWNHQRIRTIWDKGVTKPLPIPAESISQNYLRIFATLVYIANHSVPSLVYLANFNKLNIHDNNVLPHLEQGLSRIFPQTPEGVKVLKAFTKAYFRFDPVVLGTGLHRKELSPHCILPLTFKEKLSGDSVIIKKYEIHEAAGIEASEKVIVVKEYPHYELEQNFENETNAYISLSNTAKKDVVSKYFLRYHGSFIQNEKGYILLEYANEGSLLDFFRRKSPPYTREKLHDLWKNLFELLLGLSILHDHGPTKTTKQLCGVHQDLKPANIFVFREQSQGGNQYKFKIGDFGLTSFEFFDKSSNMSPDNKGGTMYSAPELAQIHEDTRFLSGGITEEADMWSFACVLFEFAVWSICGEEGREDFWKLRCQETNQYPSHVDLGYGASFHNGLHRVTAVDNMLGVILSHARIFDDFTERICNILLHSVLIPKTKGRCRAKELYPQLKNALNDCRSQGDSPIGFLPERSPPSKPVISASLGSIQPRRPFLTKLDCRNQVQQPFVDSPSSIHENECLDLSSSCSHPITHKDLCQLDFEGASSMRRVRSLGSRQRTKHVQSGLRDNAFGYICSGCRLNHQTKESCLPSCTAQGCTSECHMAPSHLDTVPGPSHAGERASNIPFIDSSESPGEEDNSDVANSKCTDSGDSQKSLNQNPAPSRVDYSALSVEQMLRWLDSGKKTELPGQASALKLLKNRDQIFIIDDSASMRSHHWEKTADTFRALEYPASQVDPDGIELYFTSEPGRGYRSLWNKFSMLHRGERKSLVDSVIDRKKAGDDICHMEFSLSTILEKVKKRLSSWHQRETSIYILTDAVWDDPTERYLCGVENPIRSLVNEMCNKNIMRTHVSLQFILFGEKAVSKRRLKYLDDDLGKELRYDIVDYRNYSSSVWNMLLGGVIAAIDAIDDDSMENNNPWSRSATLQELG